MPSGFQDFWVTGSRLYFKRDPIDAQEYDFVDLGRIDVANPTLNITKATLRDSDGGVLQIVAEKVTQFDETYDVTCSNLNLDNWTLLFMSDPAAAYTQTATDKEVAHQVHELGRLVKLTDDDADATPIFKLGAIGGIASAAVATGVLSTATITTISVANKQITVTEDVSGDLSASDQIIVQGTGLSNILNSTTYTVVSTSGTGPTVITVQESPAEDEATITGSLVYAASADTGTIYDKDTDWEDVSTVGLQRGLVRILSGGTITVDTDFYVHYTPAAITGNRLINPQSAGTIEGDFLLFYARDNHTNESVRKGRCSVAPNSTALNDEDFSNMVLTFTVLSDLTQANPAGEFIYHKGDLPTIS